MTEWNNEYVEQKCTRNQEEKEEGRDTLISFCNRSRHFDLNFLLRKFFMILIFLKFVAFG